MKKITGLAGAGGSELAQAVVLNRQKVTPHKTTVQNSESEVERFRQIQREYAEELDELYQSALADTGEKTAEIFKAYRVIVCDELFFKRPIQTVMEERIGIDYAIEQEKQAVCSRFEVMEDPYMKERASDIRNVCDELIRRLNGLKNTEEQIQSIREPFILVAEDLSPEDTVRIDKTYLRGFITEKGGITSHTVILAKSLGIPAVVGAGKILSSVITGQRLYINGNEGYGISEPDEDFVLSFRREREQQQERKKQYEAVLTEPAVTLNGRRVAVCINSGDAESRRNFCDGFCDGIGLFRTEFLFMDQRACPNEELQFAVYKETAEKAHGKEVIIRTLDIGGDKKLGYMNIPQENNPFLGYRAIRICLDQPKIFLTQLRAILRASAFGNLKIMFPMIVTAEELRKSREMVEKAKAELRAEGIAFNEKIPLGIMIETPASVLISDKLAKEADFFSIGTNDLIQYTTATDRMNEKVQYLYDPCNLSVLRAIHQVIQNAHKAGIPVGMCGEAASDARLTPLLLAMGLDEFSVAPAQLGRIKYLIRRCDTDKLTDWVNDVLESDSIDEVKQRLASEALD
ncbi:phosphoenolpyruvate--protein phosphotransferase [Caproiciproducens faecalis]|uniref:Phosphoenolpyruvate-protein phosphotransferase n=1 Tax=Caproiciproducens faecalis TaxID=2820301 RepID=A0ABS7DNK7_9FIRM|nr:phosphoenolpyruvate--protein phosphotransferase [Caproiciproducens faecalis]MBW7572676.1 phosphoenolpyruvate--protein phosphotransferase [Caproiciproducens faecalis]